MSLSLKAQTPVWQWAVSAGGTASDYGESIAVDSQGNTYVTGMFRETATFGSTSLTSSGDSDIFVAKLSPAGNWLWAVKAGGTSNDRSYAVAIDGSGNTYVAGSFGGTATFGTTALTSSGEYDVFVAKLDASGNWLWARRAGGASWDRAYGLVTDGYGNCYLTGYIYGTATFGTITLTSSGSSDTFIAKLGASGNWLWAVLGGGSSNDWGEGISIDSNGNLYVAGLFRATVTFGSTTLTSGGEYDVFVAKAGPSGNWLWAKKAGGTGSNGGYSISTDSAGNSFITGYFRSTATFGSTTLTSSGDTDIFVAKLDTIGNWLWADRMGGTGSDLGYGITVDATGNAWLTGTFQGTASFGPHTLTAIGSNDIFAAKLDTASNWLWADNMGGTESDVGYGITVDAVGNAWLTGSFQGTASFGPHTLTAIGADDIFAAKLAPPPLNADFSADVLSGPEPLMVQFTDQSTPGQYPIINWFWTFGDGSTSTLQNPLYTYLIPGIYTVTLTVMDQNYQTSTKVRTDYISVLERVETLALNSPESLSFGSVYLEEQSPYQSVVFTNTGNVDLTVSDVHFLADSLHFEFIDPFRDLLLAPGETDSIMVRFAPQAVGALSDTLYIMNNSANLPVISIHLTGTGEYVPPAPPGNVTIVMDGDNAVISWDPVTQNMHNQPIVPDGYLVFYNGSSDPETGLYYFLVVTENLSYTHMRVGEFAQHMFYHVIAYKYYGRGEPDLSVLKPGMAKEEALRLLR